MNSLLPHAGGTVTPLYMGFREGRETASRAVATFLPGMEKQLRIHDLQALQEAHDMEMHIYSDSFGTPVIESAIEKGGTRTEAVLQAEEHNFTCSGITGLYLETAEPQLVRTF